MLLTLLQFFASKFLVLALHLEAGSFPRPLSPQEEIRAFADLRAGDSSAREKLIRHNLRLVAHIAKKYYALPSEQDDLISIGTIGLMKAVDTFDSTAGRASPLMPAGASKTSSGCTSGGSGRTPPPSRFRRLLMPERKTLPHPCRCAAGRLLHGGQLRKTGRCPAPAPPHRGVACPGAETHIIKVRSGGPAAADPAGNGKAAPNKPELRFPA
mgnify:CR=1 FL=1